MEEAVDTAFISLEISLPEWLAICIVRFPVGSLTFLSFRFLIVFFIGIKDSFAFSAGSVMRSSTAFNSCARSPRSSSYSRRNRLVRARIVGFVSAGLCGDGLSFEPIMGA